MNMHIASECVPVITTRSNEGSVLLKNLVDAFHSLARTVHRDTNGRERNAEVTQQQRQHREMSFPKNLVKL